MSFLQSKELIEEGDTAILYLGRQQMTAIVIDPSKAHQTKFGCFPHKDMIGKKFGTKVFGKNGKGWLYLLPPTPELWTVTLPHRTQILYTTDISMITQELDLQPGSIVVESGTGSGSLSHAVIRTIKPTGHLYTFDFHEQRVQKAREEFESHGLKDYVTIQVADACKDGFNIIDKADAVFLDLPKPWDAIPHAKTALKKSGGRICSFSPCIEQVQRSCTILRKHGFCEIKTIECLVRSLNVRTIPIPQANLGPTELQDLNPPNEIASKRQKRDEDENNADEQSVEEEKLNEIDSSEPGNRNSQQSQRTVIAGVNAAGMVTKLTAKMKPGNINVLTSKPGREMPGHTGYLTFASLYPDWKEIYEKKINDVNT